MKEVTNSSNGINLGIAGLILGILSIPFGIMGCTFILGLVLGLVGLILSASGYAQAQKAKAQTGLIIAALIITFIGTSLSLVRLTETASRTADRVKDWKGRFEYWEQHNDNVEWDYNNDFETAFEEGFKEEFGEDLEESMKEFEEEMEQLEHDLEQAGEQIEEAFEKLTDEEKAHRFGRATGRALRIFLEELADSTDID